MGDRVKFLAYCIEIYKDAKKISGKQAFSLFEEYGVLDYVMDCYGALHTTGSQYTINDIDEFIASRREALSHHNYDAVGSDREQQKDIGGCSI
jgi:hypothetical protein